MEMNKNVKFLLLLVLPLVVVGCQDKNNSSVNSICSSVLSSESSSPISSESSSIDSSMTGSSISSSSSIDSNSISRYEPTAATMSISSHTDKLTYAYTSEYLSANYSVVLQSCEHGSLSIANTTAVYGSENTLTITPDSGYRLGYLALNGQWVVTNNNTYTFKMGLKQEFDAYFVETNKLVSLLLDNENKVIDTQVYDSGDSVIYDTSEVMNRYGYTLEVLPAYNSITSEMMVYPKYVSKSTSITITSADCTLNKTSYKYGDIVTVTASPNTSNFLYFTVDNEIVSLNSPYSFTATKNVEIKAVFGTDVLPSVPVMNLYPQIEVQQDSLTMIGQINPPTEGFGTLIEKGIVYKSTSSTSFESGVKYPSKSNLDENEFLVSVDKNTGYYQSYAVYQRVVEDQTICYLYLSDLMNYSTNSGWLPWI